MRVFLLNTPGPYAGANVECWHAARLWQRHGIDVTVVPTWNISPDWREKILAAGCQIADAVPETLLSIDGIRGAIVVSFCNLSFLACVPALRRVGCKIVWVNCMTFMLPDEGTAFSDGPADTTVFHTDFQANELTQQYASFGIRLDPKKTAIIRGAFIKEDFKFAPRSHKPGDLFCVGKVSRMDLDKWAPNMWAIQRMAQVRTPSFICMLLLGASFAVRAKLGPQPLWSVCLEPNAVSPRDLYTTCHCLLPINGTARENWPRIGLEAMASGVPIIAPNKWGWREMLQNDHSGLLRDTPEEQAEAIARLANDEEFRMFIAENGYARLCEIADPGTIADQWKAVFEELDARKD